MRNAKWFAMVAILGLALTACDDDEEGRACEIDDDCLDTEICDTDCGGGVCITPCTGDAQCGEGKVCLAATDTCDQRCGTPAGEECQSDDQCDENACQICATGTCISKCDETEECDGAGNCVAASCTDATFEVCYENDAWCASDETGVGTCEPLNPGTCSAITGKTSPANANAPMLFAVVPNETGCIENDATHCAGGYGCPFNVYWWDPNGDTDGDYSDVKYITADGSVGPIGFTEQATDLGNGLGVVVAWTCVGPNPAAVLIQDNAGNQSNGYCF